MFHTDLRVNGPGGRKSLAAGIALGAALAIFVLCPVSGSGQTGEPTAPKPAPTKGAASRPRTEQPAPTTTPPIVVVPPESKKQPSSLAIAGVYSVEGSAAEIVVKGISGDVFYLSSSDGWDGVGMLDGTTWYGVFRHLDAAADPAGALGQMSVEWSNPEQPIMRAKYTVRRAGEFTQRWRRVTDSRKPPPPPGNGKPPGDRSETEYTYVEELPEAISKAAPVYPEEARRAGVEGTVMVQAHVLEDGTVGDVRIVKSMPPFDDAAVECVRKWRFKPALSKGAPVAVWVAVPIRFTKQ